MLSKKMIKFKTRNLLLVGILAFGFLLRIISINQSLWLDEATTAHVSVMSFKEIFTKFIPGDFHPPFYYLIMKIWVGFFGSSEISLRIPSLLFGLGTVYLTYKIALSKFSEKEALIASLLTSTSGMLIYYSQEARMYSLVVFLVCLSIYLFQKGLWKLFSLTLIILAATDYVALSVVPVFYLISKDKKLFLKTLIPLFVFFVLWSKTFLIQLASGLKVSDTAWGNLLGPTTLKNILLIPVKFAIGRISLDNLRVYSAIASAILMLFSYLIYKTRKSHRDVWIWAFLPLVLGILVSFKIPTLTYFRFIFVLPAFYLLLAAGILSLKKATMPIFLAVVAINIITSAFYLFDTRFHREDWKGIVGLIESQKSDSSLTVFVTKSNWEAYLYYAPDAKIADPSMVLPGYDKLYLMRYVHEIFDPNDLTRLKILSSGYEFDGIVSVRGIEAYRFNSR